MIIRGKADAAGVFLYSQKGYCYRIRGHQSLRRREIGRKSSRRARLRSHSQPEVCAGRLTGIERVAEPMTPCVVIGFVPFVRGGRVGDRDRVRIR